MAVQATKSTENKARKSGDGEQYLAAHLAFELARVVEEAAVASARTMGQGDSPGSDLAAVQAMRRAFEDVPIAGNIVIGEGERDEAPMLYIGERVGATPPPGLEYPAVDIAVDPLEGTNLCSTGAANSIAVLAASEAGGLLHAPDCYMEKIIAGPGCQGALDLDAPPEDNLKAIAKRLDRDVDDLVVMVLDRPRHEELIARNSQGGRPHPSHQRWRFVGWNRRGRARRGRTRGDGDRRRSGRRNHGGRDALPARRDAGASGGGQPGDGAADGEDGHQRSAQDLSGRRSGAGQENHLRGVWRHAGKSAARRPILRRRSSNALPGDDLAPEYRELSAIRSI